MPSYTSMHKNQQLLYHKTK